MTCKESQPMPALRVVAVSGGLQHSSKSTVLAAHLLNLMAQKLPCDTHVVTVGQLVPQLAGASFRSQVPAAVEQALAAVEQADILIVASPVFRGAYSGMFKHFFDLIDQDALIDKPVLLAATGGSQRHALVIEHQLRPLFSFFQTHTLPLGVYATDSDFEAGRLCNEALRDRAHLAVERGWPLIDLARHQAALAGAATAMA